MRKQNTTASIKIITVLLLCTTIVSAGVTGLSYAKYVQTIEYEYTVGSSSFYFSSDILTVGGGSTAFTAATAFDIELYNYQLTQYTSYDITYSVSVTDVQRSASGSVALSDDQSGTLAKNAATTATITVTPDADILAFDITVATTNGYGKTLKMHFGIEYEITFDKQGGTGGSDTAWAIYYYDMPTATAPAKDGYSFDGYYTAINGEGTQCYNAAMESTGIFAIASDTTLYANWITS